MRRKSGAGALLLVGAFLLTRDHLWVSLELGFLYVIIGAAVLGLGFTSNEKRVNARIAGGIVALWFVLVTTLRGWQVLNRRPYLSATDPTLWNVLLFNTQSVAAFVAALTVPFVVGKRRVRSLVAVAVATLYLYVLARQGSGGFGFGFNLLMYSAVFAVGIVVGLVASVPVRLPPEADASS